MSRYTVDLPKEVAVAWRKFLGTKEGQFGVDWMRRKGPRVGGTTVPEMLESSIKFAGFHEALDSIEDDLTEIPQKAQSLDEPLLETPDPR